MQKHAIQISDWQVSRHTHAASVPKRNAKPPFAVQFVLTDCTAGLFSVPFTVGSNGIHLQTRQPIKELQATK